MHNKPQGFTLIEMMIAVAILGILAAVALPSYSRYIERGYQSRAHAELININNLFKTLALKNPTWDNNSFNQELENFVAAYRADADLAAKYQFAALTDNQNSRRYHLTATPTAASGYSLSAWSDSLGHTYKCQTAAAAKSFETSGACEAVSNRKVKK